MNPLSSRPRKGRLGSTKSNDGCITCKIRKVKCDELRPACRRCLGTGRKCDGYGRNVDSHASRPAAAATSSGNLRRLISTTAHNHAEPEELRCFEFFMEKVVPNCTRMVDGAFWHQIIPQLSRSDPVIWYAVNSLACLIRHPQFSPTWTLPGRKILQPAVTDEHRRALRWYNQSIAKLQERISNENVSSTTTTITFVSCILYICIECVHDDPVEAAALYRRAVAMIGPVSDHHQRGHSSTTRREVTLEETVRALLRHMAISQGLPVKRSAATAAADAGGRPVVAVDGPERHYQFSTLQDARDELYVLMSEAHEFIVHVGEIKIRLTKKGWKPSPDLVSWQSCIEANLSKWLSALRHFVSSNPDIVSQQDDIERFALLNVGFSHYYIWVATSLNMDETVFDHFITTFQAMIEHARHAAATRNSGCGRPVFVFETRFIPSLFFIACKCRDPVVRRQAVSLLESGPLIENTFKAEPMAKVAKRCIGIEEAGSEGGLFHLQAHKTEVPPEGHRITWNKLIEMPDAHHGRVDQYLMFGRWQQQQQQQQQVGGEWISSTHIVKI
ncbi:hypothetical protein Z517_07004 [Fonsecaea pedrosoi CBS 271.37]|uniref:Zn(2)-C6 fungal-type domain-containing protein n=1 Tax=Fonsecaea pedrosoi CBS 271.37 TaxID=1442368 RepID=A0A0D2H6W8_9EURO|nr:uncharacterized protein Z517_07004 [Fonsecaea pedrosoi CBS 271.37]KIW80389.1 hypothetical protein Z517_07004 [Fonsecaea pedrosoi CBS 271.37]